MGRELTTTDKAKIRRSVTKDCANYDPTYKICGPLDAGCYMMTIGFSDSEMCRYYERAVLPRAPEIQKVFYGNSARQKRCPICGRSFFGIPQKYYCSPNCSMTAKKKASAKRSKQYRNRKS